MNISKKIMEINIQFLILRWKQGSIKRYTKLQDGITNETETTSGGKNSEYGKSFMKIKFNADDNLSLNKPLK